MSETTTPFSTATSETSPEVGHAPGPVMTVHPVIDPQVAVVADAPVLERKSFEDWAKAHSTPAWLLAALAAAHRWAIGREVTEAEFLQAADVAANGRLL